VIYSCPRIQA